MCAVPSASDPPLSPRPFQFCSKSAALGNRNSCDVFYSCDLKYNPPPQKSNKRYIYLGLRDTWPSLAITTWKRKVSIFDNFMCKMIIALHLENVMFFNLHIVRLLFHFTSTRSWLAAIMEGLELCINTSGNYTKENDINSALVWW